MLLLGNFRKKRYMLQSSVGIQLKLCWKKRLVENLEGAVENLEGLDAAAVGLDAAAAVVVPNGSGIMAGAFGQVVFRIEENSARRFGLTSSCKEILSGVSSSQLAIELDLQGPSSPMWPNLFWASSDPWLSPKCPPPPSVSPECRCPRWTLSANCPNIDIGIWGADTVRNEHSEQVPGKRLNQRRHHSK